MEGEDHVDGIDVVVGADLLHKHPRSVRGVCEFDGAKGLSHREGGDGGIIRSSGAGGVALDLVVELGRQRSGIAVVVVEVRDLVFVSVGACIQGLIWILTAASSVSK